MKNNTATGSSRASDRSLLERYRDGETITALAQSHGRSEESVRQEVRRRWLEQINTYGLGFVSSAEFKLANAATTILAPLPQAAAPTANRKVPTGLPPYLSVLYKTPLLKPEEERHLFRKYNFLKYRAAKLRDSLNQKVPSLRTMAQIDADYRESQRVHSRLVKANMRLVVSLVKQHVSPIRQLPELLSEGNIALLNAIENFDYSRGFKFSTYATWAIINGIRRSIPKEQNHASRFQTSRFEALALKNDYRVDPAAYEAQAAEYKRTVDRLMKILDSREQQVISNRFGLDYQIEPKTLKQVGEELGVSKERARQLERRALDKLRIAAGANWNT